MAAHRLSWTQEVTLRASDKSLPNGTLKGRPVGTQLQLSDVARDDLDQ